MSSITDYNDAAPADDGTKTTANKVTYASIVTNLTDPLKNFIEANLPIKGTSAAAPTVTDDSADGYEVGSVIVNTAAGGVYICVDPTAGAADWASISGFASGTRMLFPQETAPNGWTLDATLNNAMLRVVDGSTQTFETVGSPGGSDVFTTAFSSSKATDGTALSIAQMPAHTHTYNRQTTNAAIGTGPGAPHLETGGHLTSSTGSGSAHTHTISLDPIFADVIIAVKD